jgi:hypothetical protein
MDYFQVKEEKLAGSSYSEVYKKAWQEYLKIKKKSKRRPYVRSSYFKKEKIFIDIFWSHLKEKHHNDRKRRLNFYKCALEIIANSKVSPISKIKLNDDNEILHRFFGKTKEGDVFVVQIKENVKTGRKDFISVFLWEKGKNIS